MKRDLAGGNCDSVHGESSVVRVEEVTDRVEDVEMLFLLVINTNFASILQRFQDIAFDTLYSATPLVFNSPEWRGSPGMISEKLYLDVNRWLPNGVEILPKISVA